MIIATGETRGNHAQNASPSWGDGMIHPQTYRVSYSIPCRLKMGENPVRPSREWLTPMIDRNNINLGSSYFSPFRLSELRQLL
jgi:hypothetical protein